MTAVFLVSQGLPAYCVLNKLSSARLVPVSAAHMLSAAHMSTGAEISFGTTVHGLPASTDAELYSERQRTACPLILLESRITIAIA